MFEVDLFKLKGRVVDGNGEGIEHLLLAIVDEDDLDEDDLIGLGKTMEGGHFHLTFLGSEFRQDTLEMELTPDLVVIASTLFGDTLKAIAKFDFTDLNWYEGDDVDLGDLVIEGYDPDAPTPLDGVDPTPGYARAAERLDIDDDMVRYCLAEVAPIVEKLTGWAGLLDDLNVRVQDGTSSFALRETLEAQGIDPESIEGRISIWIADNTLAPGMGCALYDPGTHTVVVDKSSMNQVGLDALKIMMGHELVHVGQFKYTPGLREFQRAFMREAPTHPTPEQLAELQVKAGYNVELEGYARYIETDYLKNRFYPMATLFYHASFLDSAIHAIIAMLAGGGGSEDASTVKASQYTDGLALYREREVVEGVPARFEFDLTKYPGGERFV